MRALHRLAATQIVERFDGVLVNAVSHWLQQHGRRITVGSAADGEPPAVRRAAARWRAQVSADTVGDGPINVRWVSAAIHSILPRAVVVEADAGAEVALRASAVLVSGRLEAAGSRAVAAAPCVLVWPEFKSPADGEEAAEVKVNAGEIPSLHGSPCCSYRKY